MPTKQSSLTLGGRAYSRACSLIALLLCIVLAPTTAWCQSALRPGDTVPADMVLLPIWGQDRAAQYDTVVCYIPVPESSSIEEKLRALCSRLRQLMFHFTGIELTRIDTINGLSIAEINLVADSTGRPWAGGYFEGSTGGHFTTVTLRESFLQRTYSGPWVDGVRFYVNHKPVGGDWDHIFLSGIFYRTDPGPRMHLPPKKEIE